MLQYRTFHTKPYNREKAIAYAHQWALKRNPAYFDFHSYGGDCTNFASQVIFAGSGVMNYTPTYGWYYVNSYNRTPSWTDVDLLHRFLTRNSGAGPFAEEVDIKDIKTGDIIQLSFMDGKDYGHSLVVLHTGAVPDENNIRIATHTFDRDNYPLTEYEWKGIRFIHIKGVRS